MAAITKADIRREIADACRDLSRDARRSTDGRSIVCVQIDLPSQSDARESLAAHLEVIAAEVEAR
jgi:hypothetical protein